MPEDNVDSLLDQRLSALEYKVQDQSETISSLLGMLIEAGVIQTVQYDIRDLN